MCGGRTHPQDRDVPRQLVEHYICTALALEVHKRLEYVVESEGDVYGPDDEESRCIDEKGVDEPPLRYSSCLRECPDTKGVGHKLYPPCGTLHKETDEFRFIDGEARHAGDRCVQGLNQDEGEVFGVAVVVDMLYTSKDDRLTHGRCAYRQASLIVWFEFGGLSPAKPPRQHIQVG